MSVKQEAEQSPDPQLLEQAVDQQGTSLAELSRRSPVLVVFLRHAGCTFCRQALADLQSRREKIAAHGTGIVLVHMDTEANAAKLFASYGLDDVPRIADPEQKLYAAFDLARGSAWQVMGPANWWRGLWATLGNGFGVPVGDVFQMPGAFLVHNGKVLRAFRHEASADRPDYVELASWVVLQFAQTAKRAI